MRSKLFVPAARPEFFDKALGSDADALSFDLEDSVAADGKLAARTRLREFLTSDAVRATTKTIIVRVNAIDSPHFADDVAAFARDGIDLINLPKCESAAALHATGRAIADAARGNGRAAPMPLLVTIETPRALRCAAEIAGAHPSVAGLQVGLNDLFAPLGIERQHGGHVHAALWTIRLGAGEAGCFAYDGAWPYLADHDGLRAEAVIARSLGYSGKSCIHPSQIAVVNAVFGDAEASLERARRIVGQAREAGGRGAFALDGEMIDRPAIAQAQALLAAAREGSAR